mmetsp:Transcript_17132/g.31986  ORF Transcript_17132/g.31986 Transcript_17132/m.31986 type:complete len:109 (-) Transcript_17132:863-1189(-)
MPLFAAHFSSNPRRAFSHSTQHENKFCHILSDPCLPESTPSYKQLAQIFTTCCLHNQTLNLILDIQRVTNFARTVKVCPSELVLDSFYYFECLFIQCLFFCCPFVAFE